MSGYSVEAKKLSVSFGSPQRSVEALREISLGVRSGESLAIVGESGSGKTTLLRACLGLVPPSGGTVALFGEDITTCDRQALVSLRRRCGYIPQDPFGCVPDIFKVGKYHLDISGKGYSMETATAIGAVPAVLRTLVD